MADPASVHASLARALWPLLCAAAAPAPPASAGSPGDTIPAATSSGVAVREASPNVPAPCAGTSLRLGPADAPIRVHGYLDPVHDGSPGLLRALARFVAAQEGSLAVTVHFGEAPPRHRNRRAPLQRVRWLAVELTRRGRFGDFLELLERHDPVELGSSLLHPSRGRAVLAKLDLPPDAVATASSDPCTVRALAEAAAHVRRGYLVVHVMGLSLADGTDLRNLRGVLGTLRVGLDRARRKAGSPPARAAARVVPELARPIPGAGVLLGGPGLPHHALLLARDEQDPKLRSALPVLLEIRSARPGRLSVQVAAAGDAPLGRDLAERLCAARLLGLELDYLRWLARPRKQREVLLGPDADLLRRLDEGTEACQRARVLDGDTPAGPWIDGRLVSAGELRRRFAGLDRAQDVWSPFLAAAAPPEP